MKEKIIGSVVAAALLSTTAIADDTFYERFTKMEAEITSLKAQITTLEAQKATDTPKKATQSKKMVKNSDDDDEEEDEPAVKKPQNKPSIQLASNDDNDEAAAKTAASKSDTPHKDLSEEIEDLKDQLSKINKKTYGNNLKFGVDFRTSYDNIQYTMASGEKAQNDGLLTNRLWLNMNYSATKNLSFTGQLAFNKTFGQRTMENQSNPAAPGYPGMEGFDWVSSEAAYDDKLRVRSAYFFYQDDELAGLDMPWTFSIGRRPSTEGHLINLRDDIKASSPLAHTVNVEFDGASAKFGTEELIGLEGSYFKLCAGRGMSEAEARFDDTPYAGKKASTTNDIDMVGIIIVPYDDKQYSTGFQYTYANNLIDQAQASNGMTNDTTTVPDGTYTGSMFDTVGGLHTATGFISFNGIGDGWSEFLDDTTIFFSGAMSKTDPYEGKTMLGKPDSQTGYSYWIGTQFPSLISDEGRWGLEFNHGSQYWRSITYGEDTLIGSKIATRGDAYEAYFTEPLVGDILTFQLRYTYLDYKYSGSNGFFGTTTGTPMTMDQARAMEPMMPGISGQIVDKAQDIRAYIRYKF